MDELKITMDSTGWGWIKNILNNLFKITIIINKYKNAYSKTVMMMITETWWHIIHCDIIIMTGNLK